MSLRTLELSLRSRMVNSKAIRDVGNIDVDRIRVHVFPPFNHAPQVTNKFGALARQPLGLHRGIASRCRE